MQNGSMNDWNSLVKAEQLADALGDEDLVVVDCRFSLADPGAGERAYRQAHIPGARYAHLDRDLSRASDDPREGRHPWPEAQAFTAKLGAWGIGPQHRVVAYDAGDGAIAARMWFLLRALGHDNVAVLDGGWARWIELGMPVDDRIPNPEPSRYVADFQRERLLDADRVQAHLDAGGLLLDARASERFRGETEPLDRVAGHVPGATNRPYADNLVDGRFKSRARLAEEFGAVLAGRDPRQLVAMCGSGVTACHHLLAMAHAGLPTGRLFTGSWSGWIGDPARPAA